MSDLSSVPEVEVPEFNVTAIVLGTVGAIAFATGVGGVGVLCLIALAIHQAGRINPNGATGRLLTSGADQVRGLLPAAPAATNEEDATPIVPQPSGKEQGKEKQPVAMITIDDLAGCTTILIVGNRGSGKSTLLRAMLAARHDAVMVYDPHAAPNDWPMAKLVHNSEETIAKALTGAYKRLQVRKDERRKGIRLDGWPSLCLAADEWSSIVNSVALENGLEPGEVSAALMKEGRKYNIGMVFGAHGTTNKNLGCEGDNDGFLNSFDWIIYLGGFARKMYQKDYPDLWEHMPMGKTPQGGSFPLIALCTSPTTGDVRLLDMRGMIDSVPQRRAPVIPWQPSQHATADDNLLGSILSRNIENTEPVHEDVDSGFGSSHASQNQYSTGNDGSEYSTTEPSTSGTDLPMDDEAIMIRTLDSLGQSQNAICAILGGNKQKAIGRIKRAKGELM